MECISSAANGPAQVNPDPSSTSSPEASGFGTASNTQAQRLSKCECTHTNKEIPIRVSECMERCKLRVFHDMAVSCCFMASVLSNDHECNPRLFLAKLARWEKSSEGGVTMGKPVRPQAF